MFIVEIEPYIEYIELFLKGEGVPNHDILRKIANIYDAHIRDKAFKEPTCIGCSNVVKHMMLQLKGAIDREGNKPIALKPIIPELEDRLVAEIEVNPEELPWGLFKKYCKTQGLNVKGKTKAELLEELGI